MPPDYLLEERITGELGEWCNRDCKQRWLEQKLKYAETMSVLEQDVADEVEFRSECERRIKRPVVARLIEVLKARIRRLDN